MSGSGMALQGLDQPTQPTGDEQRMDDTRLANRMDWAWRRTVTGVEGLFKERLPCRWRESSANLALFQLCHCHPPLTCMQMGMTPTA